MRTLRETMNSLLELVKTFDGAVCFNYPDGKYFFANDYWLELTKLKKEEVIGNRAFEFMSRENALITREVELEAIDKMVPIEYIRDVLITGTPLSYIGIKWVVPFQEVQPFFICTLADLVENKERVLAFRKQVDSFFSKNE